MRVTAAAGDPLATATDLLVLTSWEEEPLPSPLADLIEPGDWSGKAKQTLLIYPRDALPARRVLLIGLGRRSSPDLDQVREVAAIAAQRARELKVERCAFALPGVPDHPAEAVAAAIAEGSLLGSYRFLEYKTDLKPEDRHEVDELTLLTPGDAEEEAARGVARGDAVARGVNLARDLANLPPNDLTPARLAERAQELATAFGLPITVLGPTEMREQGFGGILAVGRGSANEPRFIVIDYGAQYADALTVCLVGKGMTFDSGGISIKPAENMDAMKMDMSGAAAVLGALHAIAELQLPLRVVALIGAAENMPDGSAYRPGDILKTLSGKTIEVLNTDAEGRIVLADALTYAQRYHPSAIIDLATLTGAISVALGPHAIGLFANDDALAQRLLRAGEAAGERAWQLPLWQPYREMVKSDIADVRNSAGRQAGAITAAAFLQSFVGDYPWAHLDIAGTAWTDSKSKAYQPKGATGVGVRLLVQALRDWTQK
ncbi:MAG: leucyl aminopeptidase [Roseiflexus sp.]|nr:leucyl aminopeptidase [Roseiflexus sp.]MCS7287867.1 leucyl aminopeptidase [Roseiflexus sp.]MDW8147046.1 leucyl aminopeptidase [Roseiflexaceae bacterium]MDW8232534.1 leucyl aminopeptidase [Roseiflexaceae bacterium]